MIHLFIDTNIYLGFYELGKKDLNELQKLIAAIRSDEVTLLVTDQVIDEHKRQRETVLKRSRDNFRECFANQPELPVIYKLYPESDEMKKHINRLCTCYNTLKDIVNEEISTYSLPSDKIITEIFSIGQKIELSCDILDRARLRIELGNPPGKKGLGDAINWESLLATVPESEDLFLVSNDGDYKSFLDHKKLSHFLYDEWKTRKKSEAYFYTNLATFFDHKFPSIKLAHDFDKEHAVNGLINSPNFKTTHESIAKLTKYNDFYDYQVLSMLSAAISNAQIFRIATDDDVSFFLLKLLRQYSSIIEEHLYHEVNELMREEVVDEDEPCPYCHMYSNEHCPNCGRYVSD